jgi:hypothetical protein
VLTGSNLVWLRNLQSLKDKFSEIVPKEQARVKKLKTEHGDLPLGQVTLSMVSAAGPTRRSRYLIRF